MKKIFNRCLTFMHELSERICRKINECLFSDEKIEALIVESLSTHLFSGEELAPNAKIEYDLIEDYSDEEKAFVEAREKGATEAEGLMATTSVVDVDYYFILFALKPVKNLIFKLSPWRAKKEIQDIAKHEAFHVRQYDYVCRHGGSEALDRLGEYFATTPYDENIFELGAYLYQFFDEVQDFEDDFKDFINPTSKKNPAECSTG